jgi:hypothetical protein
MSVGVILALVGVFLFLIITHTQTNTHANTQTSKHSPNTDKDTHAADTQHSDTQSHGLPTPTLKQIQLALRPLENVCLDTTHNPEWWMYVWCFKKSLVQFHPQQTQVPANTQTNTQGQVHVYTDEEIVNVIGNFSLSESRGANRQVYKSIRAECVLDNHEHKKRRGDIEIHCCPQSVHDEHAHKHQHKHVDHKMGTFVLSVEEREQCHYHVSVCSKLMCSIEDPVDVHIASGTHQANTPSTHQSQAQHTQTQSPSSSAHTTPAHTPTQTHNSYVHKISETPVFARLERDTGGAVMSASEQQSILQRVKKMFKHSYDAYIKNAFPQVWRMDLVICVDDDIIITSVE